MKIDVIDETIRKSDVFAVMEEAFKLALLKQGLTNEDAEISLTLACPEEIKELNKKFRKKNVATDVLSFPQYTREESVPEEGPYFLGDIVICEEIAREQAESYGHSYLREVLYLFVHGMGHLLGYDHMDQEEKIEMRAFEEAILGELKIRRE